MKQIREIKEGDTIFVECPHSSGHWAEETVSEVKIGEDMYKGSGRWYMWIKTNKSQSTCKDEDAIKKHVHWPILIKNLGNQCYDVVDACNNYKLKIKTSNEEEKVL